MKTQKTSEKEFNLSEKISPMIIMDESFNYCKEKDIKEFIKRLKDKLRDCYIVGRNLRQKYDMINLIIEDIDKLAGDKLILGEQNEKKKRN